MSSPGGTSAADGKFRVCDLSPGDYTLTVNEPSTEPGVLWFYGTTPVMIVDEDVRRVSAPARPRLPVPGEVVWDGVAPDQSLEAKLSISTEPIGRGQYMGETLNVSASVPGQFSFPGMMMGLYGLQVRGLPAGV